MSATIPFLGNFIDGRFMPAASGTRFASHDPATTDGHVVFEAVAFIDAVDEAVAAASRAAPDWRRRRIDERIAIVQRIKAALPRHAEALASAITSEMGKPLAEARAEVDLLSRKIDEMPAIVAHELSGGVPGAPGEQRHRPLGPTAIIGPFNFPLHLVHTHVVPTLLAGNTVVVKPSDVTPLCGQRYAELLQDADLPAGVINVVQGIGATGAALCAHPGIRCVIFTGGIETGRRIRHATLDDPHKKVCLELGGKNVVVVLDDADLDQAVRELTLGALLTTGQRCTATSRVIATPGVADTLRDRLVATFSRIRPHDPREATTFLGPLCHHASRERFLARLAAARQSGARVLLESVAVDGGAYVTPGIYEVSGAEPVVHEELFGPHLAFERAAGETDAYARAANNPFGLSASVFSADAAAFERFYDAVPAGVVNFNRSTNGASGMLPFGGLGLSGNFQPAGSTAPRLSTHPIAVMRQPVGARTANAQLDHALSEPA